jgi:hypothetical protein
VIHSLLHLSPSNPPLGKEEYDGMGDALEQWLAGVSKSLPTLCCSARNLARLVRRRDHVRRIGAVRRLLLRARSRERYVLVPDQAAVRDTYGTERAAATAVGQAALHKICCANRSLSQVAVFRAGRVVAAKDTRVAQVEISRPAGQSGLATYRLCYPERPFD